MGNKNLGIKMLLAFPAMVAAIFTVAFTNDYIYKLDPDTSFNISFVLFPVYVYLSFKACDWIVDQIDEANRKREYEREREERKKVSQVKTPHIEAVNLALPATAYKSHCFSCRSNIDSRVNVHCDICGYYKCTKCGKCFCDYEDYSME